MVCKRSATNASCSSARERAWACTSPVATQATPSRRPSRGQRAVARAVVTAVGTLQLDPQPLRAERVEQPSRGRLVVYAALGAAGQADEALGVLQHGLQGDRRLTALAPFARVGMRAGEDPAEVAPAPCVANEQRQVASAVLCAPRPPTLASHPLARGRIARPP